MSWVTPREVGYFGGSVSWTTFQELENDFLAVKQVKWIDFYSTWMCYNFRLVLKSGNLIIGETNQSEEIISTWKKAVELWDHCKGNKTLFLEIVAERAKNSISELETFGTFVPSNSAVPIIPSDQPSIKLSHCQLIYFGTNRKASRPSFYEGGVDDRTHYGICQVTIPELHTIGADKFGTISQYRWLNNDLSVSEPKMNYAQEWDPSTFWIHLQKVVETNEEGLIFIHGFNNSFQDAAVRAAQIACDIKFPGAVGAFSWASAAELLDYETDEKLIQESCLPLFEFVQSFASKVKKVHLIAHSMGNRGLLYVLSKCAQLKIPLGTVIMAAPDVDVEDFTNQYPACCESVSGLKTLYVSSKDRALEISQEIHDDCRLGMDLTSSFEGIDTVDVSKVDTSLLGHGYVASCAPVLLDIHLILLHHFDAVKRCQINLSFVDGNETGKKVAKHYLLKEVLVKTLHNSDN